MYLHTLPSSLDLRLALADKSCVTCLRRLQVSPHSFCACGFSIRLSDCASRTVVMRHVQMRQLKIMYESKDSPTLLRRQNLFQIVKEQCQKEPCSIQRKL
jgi:hypothetical protein